MTKITAAPVGVRATVGEYLRGLATACLAAADDPTPKMLYTIHGILRQAPAVIDSIAREVEEP